MCFNNKKILLINMEGLGLNNNMDEMISYDIKHQEDLQRIRGFRLLDDDFMSKVFENKQCSELLLQVKLNETYIIFITENDIIKKGYQYIILTEQ